MVKQDNDDICKSEIIHEEVIEDVRGKMADAAVMHKLADFFKVFGDSTRIRILNGLLFAEMCVCDLSALLNMNQSAVSHQLRVLKQANLVKNRREGKVIYYSLKDDHVRTIFREGFDHLNEKMLVPQGAQEV
jgi:ArsR family transcriptional regulator, lead/cadmium/zinc/bismuth-responsive transcriptional repressor